MIKKLGVIIALAAALLVVSTGAEVLASTDGISKVFDPDPCVCG